MSIRYALRENKLLDEPRASRAVVISTETVDLDGVIDQMAAAGSTFGRPEISTCSPPRLASFWCPGIESTRRWVIIISASVASSTMRGTPSIRRGMSCM